MPAPGGPSFDVVSIKMSDSQSLGGAWGNRCESGRWSARNVNVSTVVVTAYGVLNSQVVGLPDWDTKPGHQFFITATCPPGATDAEFRPMLQAMLVDRFHFAAHWETREVNVRTIAVAKTGVRLKPASGACVVPTPGPALPRRQHRCGQFYTEYLHAGVAGPIVAGAPETIHYQAWSATIADFVAHFGRLGRIGQPPMVDETGLTAKYDFDFQYDVIMNLKDDAGNPVDQSYKFRDAVEKQLGLIDNETKLQKRPMPVLVVDHVEMPTPN
jgi:uncharacterized protein (TIGR03435 family)